jgi:hypothetical protein
MTETLQLAFISIVFIFTNIFEFLLHAVQLQPSGQALASSLLPSPSFAGMAIAAFLPRNSNFDNNNNNSETAVALHENDANHASNNRSSSSIVMKLRVMTHDTIVGLHNNLRTAASLSLLPAVNSTWYCTQDTAHEYYYLQQQQQQQPGH